MKLISYQILFALLLGEHFGQKPLSLSKIRNLWPAGVFQALSRLLRASLIKKDSSGLVSITYQGKNKLLSRFPLLNYLPPTLNSPLSPFRSLTLVIFNIPESQRQLRDSLRYRLKNLGFGQINRSLYLSPHLSVKETKEIFPALSNVNGQGSMVALEVPQESFKEAENLSDFWDLGQCGDHYERALAVWETRADSVSFWKHFIDGIFNDPFLPPSLRPKEWVGTQSLTVAKEILGA